MLLVGLFGEDDVWFPNITELTTSEVTSGRCSGLKKKYQSPKINKSLQQMTSAISTISLGFFVVMTFVFMMWVLVTKSLVQC